MERVLVVMTTFGDEKSAREVAGALVEKRLAACVNLLPGTTSLYRWKGKVCEEKELVALIKTTAEGYPALEEALLRLHPYEEPEILALPSSGGSDGYLEFVRQGVK